MPLHILVTKEKENYSVKIKGYDTIIIQACNSRTLKILEKGGGVLDLPTHPRLGLCVINHPKRNPEKKWKIGHCSAQA